MPPQYIFTIENLSKAYGKKEVLKDIWLSFYPGAKIGVLGGNGSGKSTLLRIMAGVDKDFLGTARPAPGITIGYLPQEPTLDPTLDVRGNVEQAVAHVRGLLDRFDEINARLGEPPDADEMDELLDEQAQGPGRHRGRRGLGPRPPARDRHGRHAAAAGRRRGRHPLRRRAAARRPLQDPARAARHPAARRADQPPRRRERRLARTAPQEYPGHRRRRHPRPLLPRQRRRLDPRARPRARASPGRGTTRPGWSRSRSGSPSRRSRRARRRKTLARELEWVRMAPRARVAKNRARLQRYEQLASQEADRRDEAIVLQIPPGPHLGDLVVEAEDVAQGVRRPAPVRGHELPPPARRDRRRHRPQRRGQDDALPDDRRPGDARRRRRSGSATTVVISYVDQNRDALNPENTIFQEITGGLDQIVLGKRKVPARAYVATFNFKGPDQEKKVGNLSGGERNRVHLAKLLKSGGNLLLLDEPTNDLDVDMLRALEEALVDFGGCAVVISHDRWFLDRIATHILAFEGDSRVVWCDGNYQTYEAQRHERLGTRRRPAAPDQVQVADALRDVTTLRAAEESED